MRTVFVSTSSLWNCGDDFIRNGMLELLQFKSNVRILWWNRGYGIKNAYANSLDINLPLMDYFILAGTPEWIYKNARIYRHCLKKQIPLSIIGVGSSRNNIDIYHYKLMRKVAHSGLCEAIFARDKMAAGLLKKFGFRDVQLTLDPGFFMTCSEKKRDNHILCWRHRFDYCPDPSIALKFQYLPKVLSMQVKKWLNSGISNQQRMEYNKLMLKIFSLMPEPKIVTVHDNREIEEAEKLFGAKNVFYSTDYREMFERYATALKCVSSRIHGAIPCIIHGAPVHLIYTNKKAQVLEQSKDILSTYDKNISRGIKVSYFGEHQIDPESFQRQSINKEALGMAIKKEKDKIRDILKNQPVLSNFMHREKD